MKLNPENVHNVFIGCLFTDNEQADNYVTGEGVKIKVGFHPERLEQNKTNIANMLNDLPDSFHKNGGGGMSFLNMCDNKDGEQWTGFHHIMDELVALGNAIGKLSFLMPRDMWEILPGGMPYIVVE